MLVDPVIKSVASKIVRQFVANAIKGIVSELCGLSAKTSAPLKYALMIATETCDADINANTIEAQ